MSAALEHDVHDTRPPAPIVRLTNLVMRPLLRTPFGRFVKPLALVEFNGRHSGTVRRIVVGWHGDGNAGLVLTPATWRANFEGGHPATVHWSGRQTAMIGTLDSDPGRVAAAVTELVGAGTSPRSFALHIPPGHVLDHMDVIRTNRAVISFERAETTLS